VCVGIFPLFANTPSHLSWRPFVCQKTPTPGPSGALNHKHLVSATTRHFERDIDACFCAGLPVNENENPNQRPKTVSVSQGSKNKGTPGRKVGFSMWMRMWSWWARGDGASMCNFLPITFCTHTHAPHKSRRHRWPYRSALGHGEQASAAISGTSTPDQTLAALN